MRLIDADTVVHWESYDDEHETVLDHTGTIADFLDIMTYEGCPELVNKSENLDKDLVNNTISRQAALDIYDDYNVAVENGELEAYRKHRERLLALPSAQPGWIPWDSGRFPEESGTYTVTAYDGATKRVTYAKYQKRLKRWELTGARAYWRVLAWCELPKPWEGDEK